MPDDVREQAERELGRLERMGDGSGESSMLRTYLEWLVSVPWGERSEERLDPEHAREVLDADHAGLDDVKDRITEFIAVRKLRKERGVVGGGQGGGRDPDADRPSRHRQDLDRRVDRPRDRARVRPHVAGRRPRRGRDPRPSAHLHRRAAGPAGPGAPRRRDDEPGDHARRGRQGRRRLARRPQLGPARGARPGAEPLVPRPLPRRRARPLRGPVHRHRQRGGDDPGAAARPHGGRRLRRLHDRREDRDREGLPVAAPARSQRAARGRGRDRRRRAPHDRHRVHPRGGRAQPRARDRQAAAEDRDGDRLRLSRGARGARRRRRPQGARPPAALPGGRRADRRARASRPGSRSPAPAATSCSSRRPRWTTPAARTSSSSPVSSAT